MSAEGPSRKSSDGHRPPLQKTVLGTRGSELARTQARMVADRLHAQWGGVARETKVIAKLNPWIGVRGAKGCSQRQSSGHCWRTRLILECIARKICRVS